MDLARAVLWPFCWCPFFRYALCRKGAGGLKGGDGALFFVFAFSNCVTLFVAVVATTRGGRRLLEDVLILHKPETCTVLVRKSHHKCVVLQRVFLEALFFFLCV